MGDADELWFVTEGDDAMPVLKPDRTRGLQARRGEAHEFVKEDAAVRIDPAFWHELNARFSCAAAVSLYHIAAGRHFLARPSVGGMRSKFAYDPPVVAPVLRLLTGSPSERSHASGRVLAAAKPAHRHWLDANSSRRNR